MGTRRECENLGRNVLWWVRGTERKVNWRNEQEGNKEGPSSMKKWLMTFLSQMELILPHLALSFPEVLGSSKVRQRGETQCQPITELWIPTSSKVLSVLVSMVRHPHSPLSMPTLFHPPFGQLITWYRQACPLEEGKVKHWCLLKVCLCRSWGEECVHHSNLHFF